MLTGWMVYLIGVVVGMAAMYAFLYTKKSGTLMIDKTDPKNTSNLYLELQDDIEVIEERKKVVFNVKVIR